MTKILVTGATSFIGRRFVADVLARTDWEVISLERLRPSPFEESARFTRLRHDLRAEAPDNIVRRARGTNLLVHLAADVSGVKSLADPRLTVDTNVVGTYHVLELARKLDLERFVYMSSGEAVGAAPFPDTLAEDAPLRPSNPYAASKAAAEALVNSYRTSYKLPTVIVRAMCVFGPGQATTRFVPMAAEAILEGRTVKCHVGPYGRCGSRNWLHVEKLSGVLLMLLGRLSRGKVGETYHIVGPERTNVEILRALAAALHRNLSYEDIVPGPSHDLRYALRDTKLGLNFDADFDETLADTARWYDFRESFL